MLLVVRLIIYLAAIVIYYTGRHISKSILHPIRVYTTFWIALIVIAISGWDIDYKWNGYGLLWIEASLFFTEIGSLIVTKGHTQINPRGIELDICKYDNNSQNWKVLYIIIGLSFLSVVLTLSVNGFHLSDLRSFSSILSVSSEMTQRRYVTGEQSSTFQKIVSIFGSLGVISGGYAFSYAKSKMQKIICLMSFVPILLTVLLTTAKSGMIASIILFLAGWTISNLRIKGNFPVVDTKLLVRLSSVLIGILLLLYFAMLLRVGNFSESTRKIINDKFFVYGFGEMVEFDGWFADGKDFQLYQMGTNTYMVLPRALGIVERMQGVYDTYVYGYGNVFTVFRGIIADFGLLGGLLYSLLRGFITQYCCYKIAIKPEMSYVAMTLLGCQYFFGLYGFIISPWIYTTYVFCMVGFLVFMFIYDRRVTVGGR